MASGSSGRNNNNSGPKGFDFASDDILRSYEEYGNPDGTNGNHSDPVIGTSSAKEFHKNRMARSSMFPTSYSPPEESLSEDVIATVERTMKKYADNLMRFLEGISSRLSQLELYCYNLDKSIGEMRSDLVRDHGEADSKLKSLEKHLQEVHRSVQILRDKQELADAQKELAKFQLSQKDPSSANSSQPNEERAATTDSKKTDGTSDVHNLQLALALPHQVPPQTTIPTRPVEQQQPVAPPPSMPPQSMTQSQSYYLPPPQVPTQPLSAQAPQGQYLPPNTQYQTPQMQDISRVAPQPLQSQMNQTTQIPPLPQYQQQWPQQLPQQVQPPQQAPMQSQIRPSSSSLYPTYLPNQATNPSPPENLPSTLPMQVPFPGVSPQGSSRADAVPYGYGSAGRPVQPQPPPQHLKVTYGGQPGDGYSASGPHATLSQGNAYLVYDGEGGRMHHPPQQPHFPQSGYPPTSIPLQNPQAATSSNLMVRPSQFVRNHPYNELIEKLVSMGYRGDHVVNIIQRLEESGQPVDFNAVLDLLNGHSSGSSQRGGWSG